ncbi:MAG: N-acetyl-gamma-glutamyl-phosphate reductase [Phycisphaerales bacterium]|nr:N-acetyl-gamma-glutamyl-phosphate reductase [Phycisphaerales bacterium]
MDNRSPLRQTTRVAIVGATGYAGAEAVGLLLRHPGVDLVALFGSSRNTESVRRFDTIYPRYRGWTDLEVRAATIDAIVESGAQAVFLATPHEASHDLAPALLAAGFIVFDLSAAFRLRDNSAYRRYYGFEHAHSELLARAVYGLAELNRAAIAEASLIAVPGCYPTSVILPLAPLVRAGLLAATSIIVDSTSGVSGAGRTPALKSMLCEVSQQPYGVLAHRHEPEMIQEVGADIVFTAHLGPYDRGILSTIHATVRDGVGEDEIRDALNHQYAREPFVRVLAAGEWPSVGAVESTNQCDIALAVDTRRRHLIVASAIDNLVKGAAGQAVQCLNIRCGYPESWGIARHRVTPLASSDAPIGHARDTAEIAR